MRIGILGGTRFIGYHLVEALLQIGVQVVIFHRGWTTEPRVFSQPVKRIFGNRNNVSSLGLFFEKEFDAVVDLSGHTEEQVEPILSRWRTKIGHYIFCSTSSVYKIPPSFSFSETESLVEEKSTYGGDKKAVEDRLLKVWEAFHWPVTIFRPQGVLGPFGALQPLYVMFRIAQNEPVFIRSETVDKKINFLWVGDLVWHLVQAIGRKEVFGQAFNVACDEVMTPSSFLNLIQEIMGKGEVKSMVLGDPLSNQLPRLGLPWLSYDLVANNEKTKKVLGITFTPMRSILDKIWQWYKTNLESVDVPWDRWEKEARQGQIPPSWRRLYWRFVDGVRY